MRGRVALLSPSKRPNQIIRYVVAVTVREWAIQNHAIVVMSNHWHLCMGDELCLLRYAPNIEPGRLSLVCCSSFVPSAPQNPASAVGLAALGTHKHYADVDSRAPRAAVVALAAGRQSALSRYT